MRRQLWADTSPTHHSAAAATPTPYILLSSLILTGEQAQWKGRKEGGRLGEGEGRRKKGEAMSHISLCLFMSLFFCLLLYVCHACSLSSHLSSILYSVSSGWCWASHSPGDYTISNHFGSSCSRSSGVCKTGGCPLVSSLHGYL